MYLLRVIAVLVLTFLLLSFLKYHLVDTHTNTKARIQGSLISEFSAKTDEEWINNLKYSRIVACQPFDAFDAYADKFIIKLESGQKAMIKLMEKTSLFDRAFRTLDWHPYLAYLLYLQNTDYSHYYLFVDCS